MKIAITSDSVIDLTKELLQEFDIKVIPIKVLLGDDEYSDGEFSVETIFDFVKNTGKLPKTSAVNEVTFKEFFEDVLKEYDAVVHFDISSSLSATYNNAKAAAESFGGKVEVIDTKTLSTGMALLALYARDLTKTESDVKVIAQKVRERVDKVQASFVVENLDFLCKGGRCSSLARFGANILKIRPQILAKDGKLGAYKNYRGPMPAVIAKYTNDIFEEFSNPDKTRVFITYSTATPEMIDAAMNVVKEKGFEKIYVTQAGCTVTSHCGEHTLGVLYINDGE